MLNSLCVHFGCLTKIFSLKYPYKDCLSLIKATILSIFFKRSLDLGHGRLNVNGTWTGQGKFFVIFLYILKGQTANI